MKQHEELGLLSAFLDGELDDVQRTQIEAHLGSCAECAEVVEALRGTLADFESLDAPEPSAQDSWALRSALAAARRAESSKRYPRYLVATAGVAASIVAIFAFTSQGGDGRGGSADVSLTSGSGSTGVFAEDYDETSARAFLDAFGGVPAPTAPDAMIAPQNQKRSNDEAAQPQWSSSGREASCIDKIAPKDGQLVSSFQATFKGKNAFFYVFEVPAGSPSRLELWITAPSGCDPLFWAQRQL